MENKQRMDDIIIELLSSNRLNKQVFIVTKDKEQADF